MARWNGDSQSSDLRASKDPWEFQPKLAPRRDASPSQVLRYNGVSRTLTPAGSLSGERNEAPMGSWPRWASTPESVVEYLRQKIYHVPIVSADKVLRYNVTSSAATVARCTSEIGCREKSVAGAGGGSGCVLRYSQPCSSFRKGNESEFHRYFAVHLYRSSPEQRLGFRFERMDGIGYRLFEVLPGTLGAEYNEMSRHEDVLCEGDEFIQVNCRPFDEQAMSGLLSAETGFLMFSVRRRLMNGSDRTAGADCKAMP